METLKTTYVATLQCIDQPGIVRALSAAVFAIDGNILENDQFTDPVTGQFCMRTRFETNSDDVVKVRDHLAGELTPFAPTLTLRSEAIRRRALVMVSKVDHCLADLLYRREQGDLPLDVVAVVSNHDDCASLAARYDVPFFPLSVTEHSKESIEELVRDLMTRLNVDFIVLARYMQILSPEIIAAFPSRIINIHPSLLPYFPGASPYRQAYESGARVTGCTAHFVTEQLDQGPIILQDVFHINVGVDTAEDVREHGLSLEAETLTKAVKFFLDEELVVVDGKVVFKPGISTFNKAQA